MWRINEKPAKKSIAEQAQASVRKGQPRPGHAHATKKDYKRKPKFHKEHEGFVE